MIWKSADRLIDVYWRVAGLALVIAQSACGGAADDAANGGIDPRADTALAPPDLSAAAVDAVRFLTQATFGPTDAEVSRVIDVGYSARIDEADREAQVLPSSRLGCSGRRGPRR